MIRYHVDLFIEHPEFPTIDIPTEKPQSARVIAWREIKRYEKQTGRDLGIVISVPKDGSYITLTRQSNSLDGSIVTMRDGTRIPLKDLIVSKGIKEHCEMILKKVKGELNPGDEVDIPSPEEIQNSELSKADKEYYLKTLETVKNLTEVSKK